jgi:hypothetical protein
MPELTPEPDLTGSENQNKKNNRYAKKIKCLQV